MTPAAARRYSSCSPTGSTAEVLTLLKTCSKSLGPTSLGGSVRTTRRLSIHTPAPSPTAIASKAGSTTQRHRMSLPRSRRLQARPSGEDRVPGFGLEVGHGQRGIEVHDPRPLFFAIACGNALMKLEGLAIEPVAALARRPLPCGSD